MPARVQLEPEFQEFVDQAAQDPPISELGPAKARQIFDELQSGTSDRPAATVEDRRVVGDSGVDVSVQIVRPKGATETLPPIVYFHGGGWVVGGTRTHDRLVRELATGAGAAVVFVDYSLSPEAKYPTALEECYTVVKWVAEQGAEHGLHSDRLAVAGDSAGGNLAAAVTLLAKERGGPRIHQQLLMYPVTDASFDTESYHEFATGYGLRRDAMMWFWDQYAIEPAHRSQITASPLRASTEQLSGLPSALVVTAEADVLRDEGEAYANKLRAAGVRVLGARFQAAIHDFVMFDSLANTAATRGAIALATEWLSDGFLTGR